METDELEGRELAAAVAERVTAEMDSFSYKSWTSPSWQVEWEEHASTERYFAPDYRPDLNIAQAWELVEEMLSMGHYVKLRPHCFYKPPHWIVMDESSGNTEARTVEVAICRAFLKAKAPQ